MNPVIDFSSVQTARGTPTRYANITFRSQLEARWALFLDKMSLPWKYEPQGFAVTIKKRSDTAIGGYVYDTFAYLPDFRIQYGGEGDYWWLEIKGRPPTKSELQKCEYLSLGLHQTVVLVSGGFWDTPKAYIYGADTSAPFHVPDLDPRSTSTFLRWLDGSCLSPEEVSRIAGAYRTASSAWFERAERRPRRQKGHLRRLVVTLGS